jgi:hypothetical protein
VLIVKKVVVTVLQPYQLEMDVEYRSMDILQAQWALLLVCFVDLPQQSWYRTYHLDLEIVLKLLYEGHCLGYPILQWLLEIQWLRVARSLDRYSVPKNQVA